MSLFLGEKIHALVGFSNEFMTPAVLLGELC